jgi:group I intron endonuclease
MAEEHKHLIIRASVEYPTNNIEFFSSWMRGLVEKIDMKILMGPFTVYSDMIGNRGITSVVIIETSHISAHVWDETDPGIIELDVFSCKNFEVDDVVQHLKVFGLRALNFTFIDRTNSLKQEKLHMVYETVNNINGKSYVGVHSGLEAGDDYLGSGRALKNAIKKYGKENFTKKILKIFTKKESAYAYESKIVTSEYVNDPTTYNLRIGGSGSGIVPGDTRKKQSEKAKLRPKRMWVTNGVENLLMDEADASEFLVKNSSWVQGRNISEEHFKNINEGKRGIPSHRKGKTLPEEHKQKIKETMKSHFLNGYQVHNKGKKLLEIDGRKIWVGDDIHEERS